MSKITTHILDVSFGVPAAGVAVTLETHSSRGWEAIGKAETDSNGRVADLTDSNLQTGNYRLIFETGNYFARSGIESFYPQVIVAFLVTDAAQHYHVPLLLSPFGYSTYRGS